MSILPGNKTVKKITFGNSEVSKIYLGTSLVYQKVVPMPVKGDVIKFDAKGTGKTENFKVISISGTTALVLAASSASHTDSVAYNSAKTTASFSDGYTHVKYAGSSLDTYFENTYYPSLSAEVRSAIVTTSINQECWCIGTPESPSQLWRKQIPDPDLTTNGRVSGEKTTFKWTGKISNTVSRHCFALSINEIITFFDNASTITSAQIDSLDVSDFFLRDAVQRFYANTDYNEKDSCFVYNYSDQRNIDYTISYTSGRIYAIPAFRIDLSKIDFTIK